MIAKSSDRPGGQYSLFKGASRRRTRSGLVNSVLSQKPGAHSKRRNPFTSHGNGQRKRNTTQIDRETAHGETHPITINSISKEGPEIVTSQKRAQEIPISVLDFLGGCVSYSGDGPTLDE